MPGEPRPYDLEDRRDHQRLLQELHGYLHTCREQHHGTDRPGRMHALDALRQLMARDVEFIFHQQQ